MNKKNIEAIVEILITIELLLVLLDSTTQNVKKRDIYTLKYVNFFFVNDLLQFKKYFLEQFFSIVKNTNNRIFVIYKFC